MTWLDVAAGVVCIVLFVVANKRAHTAGYQRGHARGWHDGWDDANRHHKGLQGKDGGP